MFATLRRFDVQANLAALLALLSLAPFAVAAFLAVSRYNSELGQIVYGSKGKFLPVFAGSVLLSMFPSAVGFLLGWNSAGQRRNEKPTRSWIGFFLGGLILTFNVILLIAFWMRRLEVP